MRARIERQQLWQLSEENRGCIPAVDRSKIVMLILVLEEEGACLVCSYPAHTYVDWSINA